MRKWGEAAGGFSQTDKMVYYFYFIPSQDPYTHTVIWPGRGAGRNRKGGRRTLSCLSSRPGSLELSFFFVFAEVVEEIVTSFPQDRPGLDYKLHPQCLNQALLMGIGRKRRLVWQMCFYQVFIKVNLYSNKRRPQGTLSLIWIDAFLTTFIDTPC